MALQLRRGTNQERLSMTPIIGELIFVTDYDLVTLSVTAINAGTDTLTSVAHGLAVNQQIKFQDANLNGLVLNQVYFVKTVPSSDTFTLSLTSGGGTVDITGTFSIPLIFAVTPTDAAGAPLGTNSTPLWVGDGVTVGGIVAASLNLDDLLDVIITAEAEGNTFYYDATTGFWRNTNIINVNDVTNNVTLLGDLTVTGADIGTGADNVRLQVNRTVASGDPQNVFKRSLLIRAASAGTPAIGYGPALGFVGQTTATSSGNFEEAGAIAVTATDLTSTAEAFKMTFNLMHAGAQDQTVMELDSTGNLQIDGDLTVTGNNIKSSSATALTLSGADVAVAGDLTVTGNDIKSSSATAITLAGADVAVAGDLAVNGGDITTTQTTGTLFNTTATTVNIGGASTATAIGAATGTTTIGNNLTVTNDLAVNGGDITTTQTTGQLFNTTATTVNIGNGATNQVNIGSSSGTVNIKSPSLIQNDLGGASTTFNLLNTITTDLNIGGAATTVDIGANSGTMTIGNPTVVGTQTTQAVFNTVATTVNAFGASTATAIGSTVSGTTTIGFDLVVNNDLTVDDINTTQINIDSQATIDTATLTTTSTATVALTITGTRNAMTGLINIVQGTNAHCLNFTVLRTSASTAMLTTYAEMYDNISLGSFTADVDSGVLRLLVTPTSATSTVFSVVRTSLT